MLRCATRRTCMSSSSSRPTRIRQVAPPPYRFEAVPCGARSPPKRGREHTAVCGRCHHLRRRSDLDGQESVRYGWDLMARLLPNVCPSDDFSNYLEVYLRNAGRAELISALHHSLFRHARPHPPPRTNRTVHAVPCAVGRQCTAPPLLRRSMSVRARRGGRRAQGAATDDFEQQDDESGSARPLC